MLLYRREYKCCQPGCDSQPDVSGGNLKSLANLHLLETPFAHHEQAQKLAHLHVIVHHDSLSYSELANSEHVGFPELHRTDISSVMG